MAEKSFSKKKSFSGGKKMCCAGGNWHLGFHGLKVIRKSGENDRKK